MAFPVTASRAVAAAGDYAAADIISNSATNGAGTPWEFNGVGSVGNIVSALQTCSEDSVVWRTRLHLFRIAPTTSEMDDNAAKAFTEVDRANYVGYVDFPAMSDQGAISVAQSNSVLGYYSKSGILYGVLETLDAETNETAGMTIAITLYVEKG